MFEIDLSSVNPCFAPTNRPSSIEEFYGEIALEEEIEYGLAIRMPPRDRRAIKLEVKNVKKGNPVIIEPDWM